MSDFSMRARCNKHHITFCPDDSSCPECEKEEGFSRFNAPSEEDNEPSCYWEVMAYCTGIKKRARKMTKHQIKIGKFSLCTAQVDIVREVSRVVRDTMREYSPKISIRLLHMEECKTTGMVLWKPFGGKDKEIEFTLG